MPKPKGNIAPREAPVKDLNIKKYTGSLETYVKMANMPPPIRLLDKKIFLLRLDTSDRNAQSTDEMPLKNKYVPDNKPR